MNLAEINTDQVMQTRRLASGAANLALSITPTATEVTLRQALQREVAEVPDFYTEGWYAPPPQGIGVLLASEDDVSRLQYDTLRNKEFWPREDHHRTLGTIGVIHISPVDRISGLLGDFGMTFYQGDNPAVQAHLKNSLAALEAIAWLARPGNTFAQLYDTARHILLKRNLTPNRMTTDHDPSGLNFGHTIPWTTDHPTDEEMQAIINKDFDTVKEFIRTKRQYIAPYTHDPIPATGAFTVEARLESTEDASLPLAYFHLLVSFKRGEKRIRSNLNPLFDTLNMDYIRSEYGKQ